MKTNEKKSNFELIMEAIDAMPSRSCAYKSGAADQESAIKIIESLIKSSKSAKHKYLFNGKILNCQANLAKEIFVTYAQETRCTSEEFLYTLQKYKISKNAVKTEQEVREIKEKRKLNRILIEVRDIYPNCNSFETKDGVRMIVSTEFTNKKLTPIINFAREQGWDVKIMS